MDFIRKNIVAVVALVVALGGFFIGGESQRELVTGSSAVTTITNPFLFEDKVTLGTTATTTLDMNLFCIEYHPTSTETTYNITASTTEPTGENPLFAAPGGC